MAMPAHSMFVSLSLSSLLSSRRNKATHWVRKTVGTHCLVSAGPFVFALLKSAFFFKPVVCVDLLSDGFQRISARNREGDAVGAWAGGGQYRGELG